MGKLRSPIAHQSGQQAVITEVRRRLQRRQLNPGDRLPTTRDFAVELGVDKGTVVRAYRRIVELGLAIPNGAGERPRLVAAAQPPPGIGDGCVVLTSIGTQPDQAAISSGRAAAVLFGIVTTLNAANRTFMVAPVSWLGCHDAPRPAAILVTEVMSSVDLDRLEIWSRQGTTVVLDGAVADDPRFHRVLHDQAEGAAILVRELAAQGRRRILPLLDQPPEPALAWRLDRQRGTAKALVDAGLELLPCQGLRRLPIPADRAEFDRQVREVAGALIEWLAGPQAVDAILCLSDGLVPLVGAACRLAGRKPHADLSITGYDNYWRDCPNQAFHHLPPALTVDKGNCRRGELLASVLLEELVADKKTLRPVRRELLPPQLVVPTVV